MRTLALDVAELKGEALEWRYRERAYSHFAPILRRARVLEGAELWSVLDAAVERGQLTEAEAEEVAQADVVVRGRRREDGEDAYLVVEVSWGVGPQDVLRARERARLLGRAGLAALPAVAGKAVTEEAGRLALAEGVWQLTDGRVVPPVASGPAEP